MKKEDLLKLGCDEDTAKKLEKAIEAASAETLKGYVPKTLFDEVSNEKKALELTVKDRDRQLETLKNSTSDIEKLKKDIEALQADNKIAAENHAAEIKTIKINAAVESALTGAKAKNPKAVRALLDLEKPELSDDGKIKGLDDQFKALLKSDPYLFDTETKQTKIKGASPAETGVEEPDTKVDVSKMTYEELAAFLESNPEAKI